SLERFIGILIEHFAGAFPLWLSPVQAAVLPISEKQNSYALKIIDELKKEKIRVEMPDSNETLGKRIREAEMQKIPYVLVVGEKEISSQSVAIRSRKGDEGMVSTEEFIKRIKKEIELKN
ncbi:threonine--tRNA ligase, partial [Candidatus Wolfebacteria bacterium]|nr:threonine--tRNA ligase [Candidatus Wolfebacteria bacterium]